MRSQSEPSELSADVSLAGNPFAENPEILALAGTSSMCWNYTDPSSGDLTLKCGCCCLVAARPTNNGQNPSTCSP